MKAKNGVSDITDKKQKDWLFQKGQSGNPQGRPKGRFSIKTRIIQRLENSPELLDKMIDYLINNQQSLILQMIDGRPTQMLNPELKENGAPAITVIRANDYLSLSEEEKSSRFFIAGAIADKYKIGDCNIDK
jgi:hypothetical protein